MRRILWLSLILCFIPAVITAASYAADQVIGAAAGGSNASRTHTTKRHKVFKVLGISAIGAGVGAVGAVVHHRRRAPAETDDVGMISDPAPRTYRQNTVAGNHRYPDSGNKSAARVTAVATPAAPTANKVAAAANTYRTTEAGIGGLICGKGPVVYLLSCNSPTRVPNGSLNPRQPGAAASSGAVAADAGASLGGGNGAGIGRLLAQGSSSLYAQSKTVSEVR